MKLNDMNIYTGDGSDLTRAQRLIGVLAWGALKDLSQILIIEGTTEDFEVFNEIKRRAANCLKTSEVLESLQPFLDASSANQGYAK